MTSPPDVLVSKNVPSHQRSTMTRPARLRVTRPDVEEALRSPRRGRPRRSPEAAAAAEEGSECVRYGCAFQEEGKGAFAPPELVWGKVRSHSWWPGQVFDAADASELALQHRRAGTSLVAYFWDRTFAWNGASALCPFGRGFARLAGKSTMSSFTSAVDTALCEVTRRVDMGLSCGCTSYVPAKKQEFENAGIREGAYGAVVDAAFMRDAFRAEAFLEYISALGRDPLAGADRLDLTIAKAQLRVFNGSRGPRGLPEFAAFEGIEDTANETPLAKDEDNVAKEMSHAKRKAFEKGAGDRVSGKEKKSRDGGNAACDKVDALEDGKGLGEGDADDATSGKGKKSRRGERSMRKGAVSDTTKKISMEEDSTKLIGQATDNVLEDANEPEKQDAGAVSTGKDTDHVLSKEKKARRKASSAGKKKHISEDGEGLEEPHSAVDTVSGGKKKARHSENSAAKKELISGDGRKKKKLSELMVQTGTTNSAGGGKRKAQGKRTAHASAEKPEDPDLDLKDSANNRKKKKKLDVLGDVESKSQLTSHQKFSKVAELMCRAAGQISQTPAVLKANGAAAKASSSKGKHRRGTIGDGSPSGKAQGGREGTSKEDSCCSEMLSQLTRAAHDPKRRESFAPTTLGFFTDFRNSHVSGSLDNEAPPEKLAMPANTGSAPSEPPLPEHMQDSFWADIVVNDNKDPEEELLSSLRKKKKANKKGNLKKKANKTENEVKETKKQSLFSPENGDKSKDEIGQGSQDRKKLKSEIKLCSGNRRQLKSETKSAEEMGDSLQPAGLVLNFNKPSAVPSVSDLIKIFSQYGPVKEAKTEIADNANRAQVIFNRHVDAEAAFAGAGKISVLGPALISFRLTYLPSTGPNDHSQGTSKSEKDSLAGEAVQ